MTETMFRILVVEDDAGLRDVLRTLLEAEGYRVIEAETAARALIEARSHKPDAVLADLGLPDRDGQIVIRRIREFSPVPIIVLSARAMEADKVLALDGGADDYVTKPFSSTELLARVRAALRRSARSAEQQETLRLGRLSVNFGTREAVGPDGNVHFTPVEYRLLACLARGHGLIVTQDQIIREVWGPDRVTDTRGLRSYVKMLREKIEPDPALPRVLVTEPGVGYRLIVEQ
ncbi:MAG: two-component system, OmpR family, operon response regulator KdpE [Pseudomonadota bacterium]|jgi:DNA-binding response OmpR family regulator|nr:two-component system, OmpR family, operon response regulator KdpE [Pseudomonadota bacterium]